MPDNKLALLSAADRKTLEDQFADASKSLSNGPDYDEVDQKRQQYADQLARLKKEDAKDPAGRNNGVTIPEEWTKLNAMRFFTDLDGYYDKDPKAATNLLADVMTGPVKDSPWKEDTRSTFTAYVSKLSNPDAENAEHDIKAADAAMKRVYDTLPADDPYRRTLQTLATVNGYDIATGRDQGEPTVAAKETGPEHQPRYVVSGDGHIASHLPVPSRSASMAGPKNVLG